MDTNNYGINIDTKNNIDNDIKSLVEKHNVKKLIKVLSPKKISYIRKSAAEALGDLCDPRAVEPLITTLGDSDADVRKAAVEALGKLNDQRAVEPLNKALSDANAGVRWKAVKVLGEIKDLRSVEPLNKALSDSMSYVRQTAAEALSELCDSHSVEPLITTLGDSDADVREAAVEALRKLKDPRAVEPLIRALADIVPEVRKMAANALAELGEFNWKRIVKGDIDDFTNLGKEKRAVELLIKTLGNNDIYLRRAAALALMEGRKHTSAEDTVQDKVIKILSESSDQYTVNSLIKALEDSSDDSWCVRMVIAEVLGKLKDPVAVEPLIKVLDDDSEYVRPTAARALYSLNDQRTLEPFIKALSDNNSEVREIALSALVNLNAIEPLFKAIIDGNGTVRSAAAQALGELRDPRSVELLIKILADSDPQVRKKAADSLGKLNNKSATEPLIIALNDRYYSVVIAAAEALGELKDSRAVEPLLRTTGDFHVRRAVTEALGELNDLRAVEPLIKALGDNSSRVRAAVARTLGKLNDLRAVEPLIKALNDRNEDVRAAAAAMLGELKDPRAVDPLIWVLGDEYIVRKEAAKALNALGEPKWIDIVKKSEWETSLIRDLIGDYEDFSRLGESNDTRAIKPLIRALGDKDETVRIKAAQALAKLGEPKWVAIIKGDIDDFSRLGLTKDPRAVEPLIKAMACKFNHEDWGIRSAAVKALGELKDPRAIEPLTKILGDSGETTRKEAAEALTELGETQWTKVIEGDNEDYLRLCRMEDPRIIDILKNALFEDHNIDLARALGKSGYPYAFDLLVEALDDYEQGDMLSDPSLLRRVAAEELGKLNDIRAIKPLLNAYNDECLRPTIIKSLNTLMGSDAYDLLINATFDNMRLARIAAVIELGRLKDSRAIGRLRKLCFDEFTPVRVYASVALSNISGHMEGEINKALNHKDPVLIEALGEFSNPSDIKPLHGLLGDENAGVRISVVKLLGRVKDPQAIEPLIRMLCDRNWEVRKMAARSLEQLGEYKWRKVINGYIDDFLRLGELKDPRMVEPLIKIIENKDEDMNVRTAAIKGLGESNDSRAVKPLIKVIDSPEWDDSYSSLEKRWAIRSNAAYALIKIAKSHPELDILSRVFVKKIKQKVHEDYHDDCAMGSHHEDYEIGIDIDNS